MAMFHWARKMDLSILVPLGSSTENVTAQLIWATQNDGKTLTLCWQITFAPAKTADVWLIRIDATNNKWVDEDNLTIYCD